MVTRLAASPSGSVFVSSFAPGGPQGRLAEIDAAGKVTSWMADSFSDLISALEFAPSGALMVGSSMAAFGGEARTNLAAFDLGTNTLLPWAPSTSAGVLDLAIAGDIVFVAGSFNSINGVGRTFLGTVDAQTGAVLPWNPAPDGVVTGLMVHDSWVYARGGFGRIGGAAIAGLARVDVTSGTADRSWRPGVGPSAMVIAGDVLYVGGSFQAIAGQTRQNLAAFDLATGRLTPWNPGTNGSVSALAADGGTLYVAGLFTQLTGQPRAGLGALDLDGGALLAWNPGIGNGSISSLAIADARVIAIWSTSGPGPSSGLVALAAIRADGQVTGWNPGFEQAQIASGFGRVVAAGDALIATGNFGAQSPAALQGVAAFALDGPAAPSGLRATSAGPAMRLEWNGLQPPAGGYTIEAGSAAGLANLATLPVGSATAFSTPVPPGTFFVRVRTQGNESSNEIVVRGGCSVPPPAPTALTVELTEGTVTLRWAAPPAMVDTYLIEAGSATGLRNVASLAVPGAQTSVSAPAPPGTYFTRVRAANGCGTSAASGETFFSVGSSALLPPAPAGLAAAIAGLRVDLSWTAVAGATGYVIEAGSASGLADLASIAIGNATTFSAPAVPPGIYVVRVRAISPAGTGPPSSPDLLVRVP
jgi:hypothetical protein